LGALLSLSACREGARPAQPAQATLPAVPTPTRRPAPGKAAADSATQLAVRFFAWYQRHRSEANDIQFLASASDADTTQSAGVSFPQVNRFLGLLRSSNCVSAAYLQNWDAYFHRQADELRDVSADGDLVAGFDFELVLHSQEGDHYLEQMARVPKKVTFPTTGRAVVTAVFPFGSTIPDNKVFHLRRYRSGWLIDSIGR
jgi:hypothetical protein